MGAPTNVLFTIEQNNTTVSINTVNKPDFYFCLGSENTNFKKPTMTAVLGIITRKKLYVQFSRINENYLQ